MTVTLILFLKNVGDECAVTHKCFHDRNHVKNILKCNIRRRFTGLLILICPLSSSCIVKCMSAAPTHKITICSIPSKRCSYYQLRYKYKFKHGFVSLPACVIELLLAFGGNQVVPCSTGSREGCSLSLCNLLPPLLIDLPVLSTPVSDRVARKPELEGE